MKAYSSNQDFYNHIDEIVEILRSTKHSKSADKIDYLIHKVAWTTSSELFGELRNEFVALNGSDKNLSDEIRKVLQQFIKTIDLAPNQ
jgi:hypothetical protein